MNNKDCAEIDAMVDDLNRWSWPRALGVRPPRAYVVNNNDDIRVAYMVMSALSRWAKKRVKP